MSEKPQVSPGLGPSSPAAPTNYAGAEEALVSAYDLETPRSEQEKPPPPPRTGNERKHVRSKVHIHVCIRRSPDDREEWGRFEEVTLTEDCSRGGFAFRSHSIFRVGVNVEVALPYQEGGANIFVPARIANARKLAEGAFRYGVAYVRQGR